MILERAVLQRIVSGELRVVYRRWLRPSVRAGGTLMTALGVLAIEGVTAVSEEELTEADARVAGHASRDALLSELKQDGTLYRIELRHLGPDPRVALRERAELAGDELASVQRRLARMDGASHTGPWTLKVLETIAARPAVRAALLAKQLGQELLPFKRNVRKLKELGLTESLEVGYRLSPRGASLLELLRGGREPASGALPF